MAKFLRTNKRKPLADGPIEASCHFSAFSDGVETDKNWNVFELFVKTNDPKTEDEIVSKLVLNRSEALRIQEFLNRRLAEKRD